MDVQKPLAPDGNKCLLSEMWLDTFSEWRGGGRGAFWAFD